MATSVKIEQKGAFQLEAGQTGAGQSPGWGQSGSEEALGANDAYPWLQWPKNKSVNSVDDNSVTSEGFRDVPRKVSEMVENPWGVHARFQGMGSFNYWMFGYENSIVEVCCFVLDTPTIEPTAGATYRDTDLNDFTFLRKETWGTTIYHIFRCDDSVVPTLDTGDLDQVAGTGDDPLTFSDHSVLMYEHLLELDSHSRHLTTYETAEQITGWASGDKKNRMATIGIKMGTNDFRYKNAMCNGFNFVSSSGQLAELNGNFLAYDEERGDYSSTSWTYPSTRNSSDDIIAHHQIKVQIGVDEDNLVDLGCTDINVGVGIPLQSLQDTESGTHIAEPVMQGKYDVSCALTLSRHTVETYQTYRDDWTTVVARIAGRNGYYMTELLIQEGKLSNAGPDDGDVATEPLVLVPGFSATSNWSGLLYGNTLIQNGPLVMRVRDIDSTNHMFEI